MSKGSSAGVQASLASATRRAAGHAARTWRRRASSPAPPSLSFKRGMPRATAAAALEAIASALSRLMV